MSKKNINSNENNDIKETVPTDPILIEKHDKFDLIIETVDQINNASCDKEITDEPVPFDPSNFHDDDPLDSEADFEKNQMDASEGAMKETELQELYKMIDKITEKNHVKRPKDETLNSIRNKDTVISTSSDIKTNKSRVAKEALINTVNHDLAQAELPKLDANALANVKPEDRDYSDLYNVANSFNDKDTQPTDKPSTNNIIDKEAFENEENLQEKPEYTLINDGNKVSDKVMKELTEKETIRGLLENEEIPTKEELVKECMEPIVCVAGATTPPDPPTPETTLEKEISPSTELISVVEVNNVYKKYKHKYALQDFSITINKGDIYGLIGVNGAGKSTLIKIITGLTNPTKGTIKLFGKETQLDNSRKKIGSIIENPTFSPNMTAKQILQYYCIVKGLKDKELPDKLLKQVHLEQAVNQKFKEFSLGMKQRLGLAFALMDNPEFIILDEPTNGLDPVGILELRDIIQKLNKEGVTFLICSHILSELSQIATKYGIVHDGKFIREFTAEELEEECKDAVILTTSDTVNLTRFFAETNYKYSKIEDNQYKIVLNENFNDVIVDIVKYGVYIEDIKSNDSSLEDVFLDTIIKIGGAK